MYTHNQNPMIMTDEFFMPFEGRLNPDNRWVSMASLIPWAKVESEYVKRLGGPNQGSRAKTVRFALSTPIIKKKLGLSDEETFETVTENPYMQCFPGFEAFKYTPPFEASSMSYFRKQFDADYINSLNERMVERQQAAEAEPSDTADKPENDDYHKPPLLQR